MLSILCLRIVDKRISDIFWIKDCDTFSTCVHMNRIFIASVYLWPVINPLQSVRFLDGSVVNTLLFYSCLNSGYFQ